MVTTHLRLMLTLTQPSPRLVKDSWVKEEKKRTEREKQLIRASFIQHGQVGVEREEQRLVLTVDP